MTEINGDIVGRTIRLLDCEWDIVETVDWSTGYVLLRAKTDEHELDDHDVVRPASVIRRALQIDAQLAAAGVTGDPRSMTLLRRRVEDDEITVDEIAAQLQLV